MKKNLTFLPQILLCILLGFTCCHLEAKTIEKEFQLEGFTEIKTKWTENIKIYPSEKFYIKAIGSKKNLKRLRIKKEKQTLVIYQDDTNSRKSTFSFFKFSQKVRLEIGMPDLHKIDLSGTGDMIIEKGFQPEKFYLSVTGIGDIKIKELHCKDLTIQSDGIGDVAITGSTSNLRIEHNGIGDCNLKKITCQKVFIHKTGLGDLSLQASESAEIKDSGKGNITFKSSQKVKRESRK